MSDTPFPSASLQAESFTWSVGPFQSPPGGARDGFHPCFLLEGEGTNGWCLATEKRPWWSTQILDISSVGRTAWFIRAGN